VLPESQHVYDVTVDPAIRSVSTPSGFDQAAFRSTGPRGDLDADPRLQLQVGPARHRRSEGRLADLRHDVRRQRLARPGRGRCDRRRGRREGAEPARPARPGRTCSARTPSRSALARKDGKSDPACYRRPPRATPHSPRSRRTRRRSSKRTRRRCAPGRGQNRPVRPEGRPRAAPAVGASRFRPTLPVNVFGSWLAAHAKGRASVEVARSRACPDQPRGGARRRRLQELFAF
jgi:hypothetical protein